MEYFKLFRDFPNIGFLPPPPPFIFVPLSPSLAPGLGPLAYSSRSATRGWEYKNQRRGGADIVQGGARYRKPSIQFSNKREQNGNVVMLSKFSPQFGALKNYQYWFNQQKTTCHWSLLVSQCWWWRLEKKKKNILIVFLS